MMPPDMSKDPDAATAGMKIAVDSNAAQSQQEAETEREPAKVILSIMRGRRIAVILLVLNIGLVISAYIAHIWPIFLKHDLTNPAVTEMILSDSFRDTTRQMFNALQRYNEDPHVDAEQPAGDFYARGGRMGLVVGAHYQLKERAPRGKEPRVDSGGEPSSTTSIHQRIPSNTTARY